MSDVVADVLDVAQGLSLEPTHSVAFSALTDAGTATDTITLLRSVDVIDLGQIGSVLYGEATQDIKDLADGWTRLTATRGWYADVTEIAVGWDKVTVGAVTFEDVVDTAEGVGEVDGPYPPVTTTDTALAFSLLEGNSTSQPNTLETGWLLDRVNLQTTTDVNDTAEGNSVLDAMQQVSVDVQDTAAYVTTVSSIAELTVDIVDLAGGNDVVSVQNNALADLIENAFVFSLVSNTDTVVDGGAVAPTITPEEASNTSPFPLGVVFTSSMGWTCNTHTFAMSAYTGGLTMPGFTGIVTTGRQQFSSNKSKRVARAFMQLSCETEPTLKVMADGRGGLYANEYPVRVPESGVGPETQRIKLGRGATGDRWTFQLEGVEPFRLESFGVLISEGVMSHG